MTKLKDSFIFAFIRTVPVLCGYLFLGVAFGLLMENAGLNLITTFFMSLFVFAGSMQYLLVSLISTGASLATVALMTLLLNGRHMFYGLSFIEDFKKMGKKYFYMVFSLTDETYSLLCSIPNEKREGNIQEMFFIAVLDHAYWIGGSVLGFLIGSRISFDLTGIDFAMTALFVVIFIEQILNAKSKVPAFIGTICGVVFLIILGPDKFILPSLATTVMLLLGLKTTIERKEEVYTK